MWYFVKGGINAIHVHGVLVSRPQNLEKSKKEKKKKWNGLKVEVWRMHQGENYVPPDNSPPLSPPFPLPLLLFLE